VPGFGASGMNSYLTRCAGEPATLRDNHAVDVTVVQFHRRSDRVMTVLRVDEGVLHQSYHPGVHSQRCAGAHKIRPSSERRIEPLNPAVVDGQHVIADRLFHEEGLHFFQLGRVFRRKIVGFAEIFSDMVEFPHVLSERRIGHKDPWDGVARCCDPSVIINAPVANSVRFCHFTRNTRVFCRLLPSLSSRMRLSNALQSLLWTSKVPKKSNMSNKQITHRRIVMGRRFLEESWAK
jgi:hypothetical protein